MKTSPLTWGVVGLGIGRQHAVAISESSHMALGAVCDRSPGVLEAAARDFADVGLFSDPLEMVHSGRIDAVAVATYDRDHAEIVVEALEAGLHVFCEKPLAATAMQLSAVVEALNRDPSLRLTTNTLLRRSPRFVWLRDAIRSGRMGTVYHAEVSYLYGRLEKLLGGWRGEDPDYSVTLGGTVHLIDLLMWLVEERPTSVQAIGSSLGTTAGGLVRAHPHVVQDLRSALLEFDSGLTASATGNFACVHPHFHRVDVFGTEATFLNAPQGLDAYWIASRDPIDRATRVDLPYPSVPKSALLTSFASAITRGTAEVTEQEAVDAVSVALAIDQAAVTGSRSRVVYERVTPRAPRGAMRETGAR